MKKIVFVSPFLSEFIIKKLSQEFYVIRIPLNKKLYEGIQDHPDVQMLSVGNHLYIHESTYASLPLENRQIMSRFSEQLTVVEEELGNRYPLSVPFNGKIFGKTFIHNLVHTSRTLRTALEDDGYICYHVKQGYTGCSLCLLNDRRGFTSDNGIYDELTAKGFDLMFVSPKEIKLDKFPHGFIGGACALYGRHLYVNGNITKNPNYKQLVKFIKKSRVKIIDDPSMELEDRGSMIFWDVNYE